ncbi:hypothetical protein HRJ45_23515 [Vibrio coralliilyticus]|uniref:hypothetical protein n=1 Tax=Vibrio coralliilyticus TaxID=190893 RepID=UPI0015602AC3|nr:hypothetical protein [Vibrio coralliilyticus]NRF27954.1 hypothetical protein [Vibrio coralliilyticus]NRF82084.1 hypothetical protein [Vibrio coralliilyticus]
MKFLELKVSHVAFSFGYILFCGILIFINFKIKENDENFYTSSYTVESFLRKDYHANVMIDSYINNGKYVMLSYVKETDLYDNNTSEIQTSGIYTRSSYNKYLFTAKKIKMLFHEQSGTYKNFPITNSRISGARRKENYNTNIVIEELDDIVITISYRNGGQILAFLKNQE